MYRTWHCAETVYIYWDVPDMALCWNCLYLLRCTATQRTWHCAETVYICWDVPPHSGHGTVLKLSIFVEMYRHTAGMALCWNCLYLQYHGPCNCTKASRWWHKVPRNFIWQNNIVQGRRNTNSYCNCASKMRKQAMCGGWKKNELNPMTCHRSPIHVCSRMHVLHYRLIHQWIPHRHIVLVQDHQTSYPSPHQQNSCLRYRTHQKVSIFHLHLVLFITCISMPCITQNLSLVGWRYGRT